MRQYLIILLAFMPVWASAQIVEAVKWSGEVVPAANAEAVDSVRLTATIQEGWHMTLINVGDEEIGEEIYESPFMLTFAANEVPSIRYNSCNDEMCTAPEIYTYQSNSGSGQTAKRSNSDSGQTAEQSLWLIFLLGLLGGLLAIFTPCVWPIIPMTVSFFLKRTDKGAQNAILYGLSIIVIYVGLGLLITVAFGASALNDLSTNAIVNIFFFLLLVVFALSFFGLFEITLPDSWSTALDSKARSTGGLLSILLMAFTLVIVSFSCTGPIIGTLLVEAAGRSLLAPAVGMLGFAVALALPFSLFAMFPQWLKQAPKSGDWMTSFKVVLAFLELALSLKFLSVADMAYGWGILPRWLFIAIWIACFLGIGVYLLWNIRNVSLTRKIIRAVVIIPSVAFACYLVPGLWGAPVKAISAFAPPMEIEGREVFNDYEEGLAYARQTGKPIIIDFTGYGCVNCRKMEAFVLANDSVKARLKNYVFIELYVDDRLDKDADGESEGNENSRLQRERFGSNAQPFFVQLDANGNQIAEPMAFTTDPMEFIKWLKQ
ncbi:MAG: thioredoxin family protein [Paludibacteraceae bacterium]|nr:thioredoxin family protein [Paludibacteraceae bacterium]